MISERFSNVDEIKLKTCTRIFPEISDRDFWDKAKEKFLPQFLDELKPYIGKERKMLTASLYREFTVNGNRTNFQEIYYARRIELVKRVIVECLLNDGSQMEDILDLTWMILEETSWTLPAHNWAVEVADSLPDFIDNSLDLFLSETACTMAFVYQTVGKKLDEMSTVVCRRIKATLEHVIVDDYLAREDYWWMGFMGGVPNNWNPWINSNVLAVAVMMEDNEDKLRQVLNKAIRSVDNYLNPYPTDGACDEGAHYWNQAGLSMLECLWLINLATDGHVDIFDEEKIQNTAEYFMKVYTGKGQCINFADSGASVPMYFGTMYKFGKVLGNEKLSAFAKMLYAEKDNYQMAKKEDFDAKSIRVMDYIRYSMEIADENESDFEPDNRYYLASTNVMVAKAGPAASDGLFFAAKGGHNGESHNHNDMGNFIVYKNGTKFIVDSGNMEYSKITFSDQRYTLWTTRSFYHNVPFIAGGEQKDGEEYRPTNVTYHTEGNCDFLSMDIKNAYLNRDEIDKWERHFCYDRDNAVVSVTEDFNIGHESEYELHFLTPQSIAKAEDGITLTAPNGESVKINIDMSKFEIDIETIEITDTYLLRDWGDKIYLIKLKATASADVISYTIE